MIYLRRPILEGKTNMNLAIPPRMRQKVVDFVRSSIRRHVDQTRVGIRTDLSDTARRSTDLVARLVMILALACVCSCGGHSQNNASSNANSQNNGSQAGTQDNASQATAQNNPAEASTGAAKAEESEDSKEAHPNLVPIADVEEAELLTIKQPWTGDFDDNGRRRFIRALVSYDRTNYFIDGKDQRGSAYDALMELEKSLRTADPDRSLKVAIIPTGRDHLIKALAAGYGDIAIGNLTITPERQKLVDFTDPTLENVRELVVTGPAAPEITSLDDLSGKEVHVRASSSFRESLDALNQRFSVTHKQPVKIKFADELLTDEDLIQMVDASVLPITVLDQHIAKFWVQLYDRAKVHENLALREGGSLAWAVRKNCPNLKNRLNEFLKTHRAGTTFGNMMLKRYVGSADRLKNPIADAELTRFRDLIGDFKKYGTQYQLPWLLIAAQGYQESQLDQSRRSSAGAVGIMQIKPETAADIGINDISTAENNIHAGVKYLRFILDRYFKDSSADRLNRGLFAFASYNAGPARVAGLRKKAKELGLDPDVWFNNVEVVAAREIGRETVDYVGNIFKYYTAYLAISQQKELQNKAREKKQGP
jgi:membrane-bound lytic murein transglycosylase MltF